MFIEFTAMDGKHVILNTRHIIFIEDQFRAVTPGLPGGGQHILVTAIEGRVFQLDPRRYKLEDLREQIFGTKKAQEKTAHGPDENSPVTR